MGCLFEPAQATFRKMAVTVRGVVGFVVIGLVLGFIAGSLGLFRENRTAVYVVVGATVFVSVFVVKFREEVKKVKAKQQQPPDAHR
jgi:hypothetical protein